MFNYDDNNKYFKNYNNIHDNNRFFNYHNHAIRYWQT